MYKPMYRTLQKYSCNDSPKTQHTFINDKIEGYRWSSGSWMKCSCQITSMVKVEDIG